MPNISSRLAKLESSGPSRVHVVEVPDGLERDRPTIERAKAEKGIVCGPRDTLVIIRKFAFEGEVNGCRN